MRTDAMREKDREAKRRERHRAWLAQSHGSMKCHARLGPHAICAGRLTLIPDALGRLVPFCGVCERKRNGVCRLCPRKVNGKVGWAVYCAECKHTQAKPSYGKRWRAKPYNLRRMAKLNREYRKRRKAREAQRAMA